MTQLDLSSNQLQSVAGVSYLSRLRALDLRNNSLQACLCINIAKSLLTASFAVFNTGTQVADRFASSAFGRKLPTRTSTVVAIVAIAVSAQCVCQPAQPHAGGYFVFVASMIHLIRC